MRRFFFQITVALLSAIVVAPAVGAPDPIAEIFQPFETELASLSPDGKHLAFSQKKGSRMYLTLRNLETNETKSIPVADDYVAPLSGVKEATPTRITFLRWATAKRVVFAVDDVIVWAINADGSEARTVVTARHLNQERERLQDLARRPPPEPPGAGPPGNRGRDTIRTADLESSPAAGPSDDEVPIGVDFASGRAEIENSDPLINLRAAMESDTYGRVRGSDDFFGGMRIGSNAVQRRPFVVEMPVDDPDHVIVESRGPVGPTEDGVSENGDDIWTELLKVNIHTGTIKRRDLEASNSRLFPDKQGNLRLGIAQNVAERKVMHTPLGLKLRKPLDEELGGKKTKEFSFSPESFLGKRSIPLAFDYDPNLLYFASNVENDRYGIYALDLKAKKRTDFAFEHPAFDLAEPDRPFAEDLLVFDRKQRRLVGIRFQGVRPRTQWLDPELGKVQTDLQTQFEKKVPGASVQILEWDDTRDSFLFFVSSATDPGTYWVVNRKTPKIARHALRAPWVTPDTVQPSLPFELKGSDGALLRGYLTVPSKPRREPSPLLIFCHDGPWNRDQPGYNRGAQALATMGFAVAQVNFRGSSGFGRAHLEAARGTNFDRVPVGDVVATVDFLCAQFPLNKKLVAILGNGYGGYLALRALQMHPDRFRCGVSINAPTDLALWLSQPPGGLSFWRDVRREFLKASTAELKAMSPVTHAAAIKKPLLIVQAELDEVVPPVHGRNLRDALQGAGVTVDYFEMKTEGHSQWLPGSYTELFRKLEEFFNTSIYSFKVESGEAEVVKEASEQTPKK